MVITNAVTAIFFFSFLLKKAKPASTTEATVATRIKLTVKEPTCTDVATAIGSKRTIESEISKLKVKKL